MERNLRHVFAPGRWQASNSISPLKPKWFCSNSDDIAKEFKGKGKGKGKGKDLIVLAIDVLEPEQTVKKYLVEHPRSVPIVLTEDTNLAAMYNAQVYPIYVVVDREGNIAAEQRGAAGVRGLRRILCRAGLDSDSQ
jgi:hypothetical protein